MKNNFVWYDLMSTDLEAAKAFYQSALGWNLVDWVPEGAPEGTPPYTMVGVGEDFFGGMMAMPDGSPAPSHWLGHVQVEDVDAALAVAKKAGASSPMGATDIPTVGRMAVIIDPEGCVFSVFKPAKDEMDGGYAPTAGKVGWNELTVNDTDAAKEFYSDVVGWKWRKGPMEGVDYWLFGTGQEGGDAGGMMARTEDIPACSWCIYITVEDIKAAAAKVGPAGGTLLGEPFFVPSVGHFAMVAGPDGAVFGIAQWDMPAS